ncbi:iron ABC transporter permease [Enemella evansiae]|uniref:FecCD family ABC transporter permease n=1 Tax=Enemella evansiae TaxID=2016499 RepID=UPI000B978CA6|nr:iron chelate uptake ABC transporter family permease subunit [Enemella evansiae]OYN93339.1 iron ABC transporter permease [Enemella evansiae]
MRRPLGLTAAVLALLAVTVASVMLGSNPLPPTDAWRVLWHPDDGQAAIVVWDSRLPRTVAGMLVGAAFGISGALIQALTRNPLADPGILGINAGAGLGVTLGVGLSGLAAIGGYIWFALIGGIAATVLVHLIGSAGRGAASPAQLVLAGVALSAVLTGFASLFSLLDPDRFQAVRTWSIGSIAGANWPELGSVAPFIVTGLLITAAIAGSLNAVALGPDQAISLGVRIARIQSLGIVAVTLLAGGATALTGGIAFVGLMVPHVVRWFTGPDQRWILIYTAVTAPVLVLAADVIGRLIAYPGEIAVGIVVAVIGAPVLILLVRRSRVSGL